MSEISFAPLIDLFLARNFVHRVGGLMGCSIYSLFCTCITDYFVLYLHWVICSLSISSISSCRRCTYLIIFSNKYHVQIFLSFPIWMYKSPNSLSIRLSLSWRKSPPPLLRISICADYQSEWYYTIWLLRQWQWTSLEMNPTPVNLHCVRRLPEGLHLISHQFTVGIGRKNCIPLR